MKTLSDLKFDNRFVQQLPGDSITDNHRRQVHGACYAFVNPTPVAEPQTIGYSAEVAESLGLDPNECHTSQFAQVFGGNEILPDMQPYAMCYGGHQFGNWAGQLGDGRAINLGEVLTDHGHRTLQLKGSGPTPFSRSADGLAVLRSSVREFLCSEAMHHLGIPTTRALSLVLTGDQVMRDMFYDGNAQYEPGAIVCRVSSSFVRFGSFQIFAARDDLENLNRLVQFTIRHDYSELADQLPKHVEDRVSEQLLLSWFREVTERTAVLMAEWQRVGFVHGVMNTDNMSICGETIDYGPYGWLEGFDPKWTPNTTDATGKRYRFGNQASIGHWNLYQLANALFQLIDQPEGLESVLEHYVDTYNKRFLQTSAHKLGLERFLPEDEQILNRTFDVLQLTETDMTIFFRNLATVSIQQLEESQANSQLPPQIMEAFYQPDDVQGDILFQWLQWIQDYRHRLSQQALDDATRTKLMNATNPKYVLRNYMAQLAIDRSTAGDHSLISELLDLLRNPYAEQPEAEQYFAKRPEWARERAGCSMLSCSS